MTTTQEERGKRIEAGFKLPSLDCKAEALASALAAYGYNIHPDTLRVCLHETGLQNYESLWLDRGYKYSSTDDYSHLYAPVTAPETVAAPTVEAAPVETVKVEYELCIVEGDKVVATEIVSSEAALSPAKAAKAAKNASGKKADKSTKKAIIDQVFDEAKGQINPDKMTYRQLQSFLKSVKESELTVTEGWTTFNLPPVNSIKLNKGAAQLRKWAITIYSAFNTGAGQKLLRQSLAIAAKA